VINILHICSSFYKLDLHWRNTFPQVAFIELLESIYVMGAPKGGMHSKNISCRG
jgi:hypothetical protein